MADAAHDEIAIIIGIRLLCKEAIGVVRHRRVLDRHLVLLGHRQDDRLDAVVVAHHPDDERADEGRADGGAER